ncbi:MAG: thiamine pyrophosphate-dependent enzyme, partial [Propionibacteriaceae bacterium]|nr:thiamine pyrophosphate-dependent enzyme [Propionibacteriaceae bacterium]
PATQFVDPWVNTLFQDAQPVTVGIYEGLSSQWVGEIKALRAAELELADDPDAATKVPATLAWRDFTDAERALLPTVLSISGDGAAYDIGFGAMSRVLAMGTPVKILVLDTGSYSNTGGQASTASYTGQDSDLARYGKAHAGKAETRKELSLLAAFHPHVFSAATATAFHAHFMDATMKALEFEDGGALMVVYTPCSTENGIAEELSNARSQLAVQSRLAPIFVHDPRGGDSLPQRFSLKGNPGINDLWVNKPIQYVDDEGKTQLLPTPLTPAEFALGEVRWAKQFKPLADDADGVPIADFIELSDDDRTGKTPFVYATDRNRHLIKVACSGPIVALVEQRKHYWQTLQYLAGVGSQAPGASQAAAKAAQIKATYDAEAAAQAVATAKDATIDAIAEALVTLVTSKKPDAAAALAPLTGAAPKAEAPAAAAAAPTSANPGLAIWLDPEDEVKCTDCATCYQELPDIFEKHTIIVDGQPQDVAHFKPGALDGVDVTPAMQKSFDKVKNTCDSEIIQ